MSENRIELAIGGTIVVNDVNYKCAICTKELPIINELMLDFQCGRCELLNTLVCGGLKCQPEDRGDGKEVVLVSIR